MAHWETSKDNMDLYGSWSDFLEEWPISRVRKMTLDDYTKAGNFSTFCAWIENKLDKSGSIWGGSAFKFGVYSRKDKTPKESTNRYSWNDDYAWDRNYGGSEQEAFETVKSNILKVIDAVQQGNLSGVEDANLSSVVKWKIASLYQDQDEPIMPAVFKKEHICAYLGFDNSDLTIAELYPKVMKSFDGKDIFAFSQHVWNEAESKLEGNQMNGASDQVPSSSWARAWLYAPGYNASKWAEFQEEGIIALGWEELGDLNNYADKDEIVAALKEIEETDSSKKNDATANYEFKSVMSVGDMVVVKKGRSTLLGFGWVTSDYYYDSERADFRKCRKVEWVKTGSWDAKHTLAMKTLTDVTRYGSDDTKHEKYTDRLLAMMGVTNAGPPSKISQEGTLSTKNVIFYGPPGTGKTHHIQTKVLPTYRTTVKCLSADQWLAKKIEGLNWFDVIAASLYDLGGSARASEIREHRFFQKLHELREFLNQNIGSTIWGTLQRHTVDSCEHVNYARRQYPQCFTKSEDSIWSFEGDWDEVGVEIRKLVDVINEGPPQNEASVDRFEFVTFHQSYSYEEFVEGIRPVLSTDGEDTEIGYQLHKGVFKTICERATRDPENRYAIFIDEINRGNISRIFGELITLIERDKRVGTKNEIQLKLPYSNMSFSVPNNLDIYGTMNTADRSLAYLDTALRRRFDFQELMPNPDWLGSIDFDGEEVDLVKMLGAINERLEVLLDREHTIGHAYLMEDGKAVDQQGLIQAFKEKIIPQLTDYFYEDWEKVRLVLADNQVKDPSLKFINRESLLPSLFGHDLPTDSFQERYSVNSGALENAKAYVKIYHQPRDDGGEVGD